MDRATTPNTTNAPLAPASMRPEEYQRLREVLLDVRPQQTLEIGMANGGSTIAICKILRELGHGRHTAIDPFQTAVEGWNGQGVEAVRQAGHADQYELIEDFDYIALPKLIQQKRRFDFILIDGWHSFDYTLMNLFFADLLLRVGGVVAVHDTGLPGVNKACRFLETHKPYEQIGPPISVELTSITRKLASRLSQLIAGPTRMKEAKSRREEWYSLGAYRKREDHQVGNVFFAPF